MALRPPPRTPEERAALELQLMEALIMHSRDVFALHTLRGDALDTIYVSPSVRHVLGWAPEALQGGRDWCALAHADDVSLLRATAASVAAGGACADVLYRLRTADGQHTWVLAQLCRHSSGALMSTTRSAAAHKKREEALHAFLLVTSHDLRTPCHGCAVAAQLLHARPSVTADPEATALVHAVNAGCSLLLSVIENVLAVKDVQEGGVGEAARKKLLPIRFEPHALLASVLQTCRLGCGLSHERLSWREDDAAAAALLPALEGDAVRVSHIVQNVIVYALHSSSADAPLEVSIAYSRGCDGTDDGELLFSLCDRGRELAPDERDAMFCTVDCARLGLFVARFFARAADGDVMADDDCAGGMTLRVRLPARIAPCPSASGAGSETPPLLQRKRAALREPPPLSVGAPRTSSVSSRPVSTSTCSRSDELSSADSEVASSPPPPPPSPTITRPRCFFFDDHILNLRLVKRLLEKHGFDVNTAENGLEGLQLLQASLSGEPGAPPPPALVLTDMQMCVTRCAVDALEG
jgi:signal transduction histidine kinase